MDPVQLYVTTRSYNYTTANETGMQRGYGGRGQLWPILSQDRIRSTVSWSQRRQLCFRVFLQTTMKTYPSEVDRQRELTGPLFLLW